MRSAEAARLAGVTVRTLRHYHQVGVVPEPPRDVNGYRRYGLADVVRVIRIRRLAALGVALDDAPRLLDAGADHAEELDALDARLAEQIELLHAQRAALAHVRAAAGALDLSPEIAPFVEALTDGLGPELAELAVYEMVVGFEVVAPADRAEYLEVMAPLLQPAVRARLRSLNVAVTQVADDASDEQVEALAAAVADFNLTALPMRPVRAPTASEVLAYEAADDFWLSRLPVAQRRVVERARDLVAEGLL